MRVLLINPFGSNWVEGSDDKSETAIRMAPNGLLSMAAYLEQRGIETAIHDCRGPVKRMGTSAILSRVRAFRPSLVGFTAVTSSFPDANLQAEAIKQAEPAVRIVVGGVHVSALRGRILERFPAIDLIVTGEGEQALYELASGSRLETVQGLVYREGKEIRDNGLRTDLVELDSLPFPAYGKLEGYPGSFEAALFNYPKAPTATIISSRGCPYQCSYCDRSVYRRSFRYNSADYLYEHMAFLKKQFGIRHVFFYDDLFTFNRERIEKLCAMLRSKPLQMTFNCAVRVGHADDDLLRMLKAAGCWMVSLGIESGAPEILARHKTKVDFNEMRSTVKRIQKAGLRAKGLFMMGLPGETEETIRTTTDFINGLELDDMNMTKFTPFPGSPIYQNIHDEGTFEEKWELMNCLNFVFVPKGIGSKERLDELYKQFLKQFYTGRNWVRKFWPLLFKSPHSTFRLIKGMPTFLRIKNDFEPKQK
ncbi:MAG: B12-binding domain-containing radical SAM protein [Nitrospirae bacterium GWD2_57_9]|nr:MAG: B12-binding domain-containing radical SAM protein [Nitrospirae bacterium GWD2_57_9]